MGYALQFRVVLGIRCVGCIFWPAVAAAGGCLWFDRASTAALGQQQVVTSRVRKARVVAVVGGVACCLAGIRCRSLHVWRPSKPAKHGRLMGPHLQVGAGCCWVHCS